MITDAIKKAYDAIFSSIKGTFLSLKINSNLLFHKIYILYKFYL